MNTKEYAQEFIQSFKQVGAEEAGLDARIGNIYIGDEHIAVHRNVDGTLRYYGGFEYVEDCFREALGDYVFYSDQDERVRDHIEIYLAALAEA